MTLEPWKCSKCGKLNPVGFPCLCEIEKLRGQSLETSTKNAQVDGTVQRKEDQSYD